MYTEFYGLNEKPFNLTPSPRFLYLSEGHKEALALLKYGVLERQGFILLTGEVGTGKTTMVRTLLDSLDDSIKYVHLSNPLLSKKDLFIYLALSVFREGAHFRSKTHFLLAFQDFLTQELKNKTNFNLIIDEAHKLSFDLLEEIRLLSNMETGEEKLINIFLVGQPELNEKLNKPLCRSLLQRISIRHHIPPLDQEETRDYMATRMKVAGARREDDIFSKDAVEALYLFSHGYPREINVLADNAMLLGYAKGTRKITQAMIRECYEDLQLVGSITKKDLQETISLEIREPKTSQGTKWKWGLASVVFVAILAGALALFGQRTVTQWVSTRLPVFKGITEEVTEESAPAKQDEVDEEERTKAQTETKGQEKPSHINVEENNVSKTGIEEAHSTENPVKETLLGEDSKFIEPINREYLIQEQEKSSETTMIVKEGDTLTILALAVYGQADKNILKIIQDNNPEIEDIDWIDVGQEITFPSLALPARKAPVFTVHIASYKPFEPAFESFQRLLNAGYEAYMMPAKHPDKGKIFRLTLGMFPSQAEAEKYAATVLDQGISDYAVPMQLEMK